MTKRIQICTSLTKINPGATPAIESIIGYFKVDIINIILVQRIVWVKH